VVSNKQEPDIYKVDTSYKAFPPFTIWAQSTVDAARWHRYTELVQSRRDVSDELLKRAREIVDRAAAVDTGAIEGLYETNREPSVDDVVAKLKGLYVTSGGYSHKDVDMAGENFIKAFEEAIEQQAER
jgi:hypothetical protein